MDLMVESQERKQQNVSKTGIKISHLEDRGQ